MPGLLAWVYSESLLCGFLNTEWAVLIHISMYSTTSGLLVKLLR